MRRIGLRLSRRSIIVGILALIILGLGIVLGPLAVRGPRILKVTPGDGTTDANPNQGIRIELDQWVSPASIKAAVQIDPPVPFAVVAPNTPQLGGTVVVIQPEGELGYGVQYRVTIATTLRNLVGRSLDQPVAVAFTTLPYNRVTRFGPANDAQAVALRSPLTVEFGAPVVSADLLARVAQDPQLADTLPQPLELTPAVEGVGRWLSPTVYGFYPNESLHAATTYRAAVRSELDPQTGARLDQPVAWQFATEAPLVVATRPYADAEDVPPDGTIEVRLAPDVDTTSAGANFSLRDVASGTAVSGKVEANGGQLRFRPDSALVHGVRYEANLSPGIRTTTGATLNIDAFTWHFTIIGDPKVVDVVPAANQTEVVTNTRQIRVRFNQPIVALGQLDGIQAALAHSPLTITPPLSGVGNWIDTSTYVFSPTVALAPATTYQAEVAAGLKDQTGGTLQQAFAWSFSTIMPQVLDSLPAANEQFASPRDPIKISFNQAMQLQAADVELALLQGDGRSAVAGSLTSAGPAVIFSPAEPLVRGGTYELVVRQGATSAGGSAQLAKPWSAKFRIAPLPVLLNSTPEEGAQGADPSTGIRLNFSTPMDWASLEQQLVIEPKPTRVYTSAYETTFSLNFVLTPDQDYRLTLGADARDPYGAVLGAEKVVAFRTGSLPPSLALVGGYQVGTYNAYVPARVPLRHRGMPQVTFSLYRLDAQQVPGFVQNYDAWRSFQPDLASFVQDGQRELPGGPNEERVDLLDLGELEAGTYYLRVRGTGDFVDQQIMVVSPYAITVKRSPEELFVWAVDLATGEPVADLPLQAVAALYPDQDGKPRATPEPQVLGKTVADGTLRAPFSVVEAYAPIFLWSEPGQSFAFATTNWGDGISPWEFGLPADLTKIPVVGNVYTDRPIYRPEQTVHIRGALRTTQTQGYGLPAAGQQVLLTINDPKGTVVFSSTLPLSEWGTFNNELVLERSAALGSYAMSGRLLGTGAGGPGSGASGSADPQFYGTFTVAEYRKPTFEVTVAPDKADAVQGETFKMNVEARYFSGGTAQNAPVRWRLLAETFYFESPNAPNYSWEDLDDAYSWYRWDDRQDAFGGRELVSEGTAKTDAQGRFSLSLPASLGKNLHSRKLLLDVEVTDVDGQVIAAQGAINVHAGSFYIGLRPGGYVAQTNQPQSVAILTLDPAGQPSPNRALQVKVSKREWYSVREQGADGRMYWTSRFSDTLTDELTATTDAKGQATLQWTPKEGGSYRIAAEGRDEGGHVVKSSAFTWAYGDEAFWGVNDTNRIDLIADKDAYKPGDTAKVLVPAPYKGMSALMTIERGNVIEHRVLTLPTTTEVLEVPITAGYAPNVYLSLVLIKPAGGDIPVPDLRVGLVNLPVSTEQQELTLAVTPDKEEVGPGEEVTYTVKATDYTGKGVQAEVGLALVDKAVLTLANDPNPTLKQAFYEKRLLNVVTSQSLTVLVDRVTLKIQPGSKGGGGGIASDVLVRRNMPDTAYWNPSVVTGADGTAQVTVKLPDNLTTWRMTARGLTADTQVGHITQDLVATKPLLIRPALPRFLTVGDKLALQAVVQNNTTTAIATTVTIDPGLVKLGSPAVQNIEVPANGQVVVRWEAEVPTAGDTKLRFTVSGGGQEDGVEQALPIQRYQTPEVVASAGQVQDTVVETIQRPAAQAEGQVELELVPSLAGGIESGLTYLEQFPYACSEQTVSRFLPNAVTFRLFKQLGIADAELQASLEANLTAGLQRLYTLQNLDGGWGWWINEKSNPYLTAYVIQGFTEARKAGYNVDQGVYDRGTAYIGAALGDDSLSVDTDWWRGNARAYALFVLAEADRADLGRTVALFEQRDKLAIYGRAYLLMTFKRIGGNDERVALLVKDLMSSAILNATTAHWEERETDTWNMGSDTRTTALALQALGRTDPTNYLVPNAVRYLMTLREAGHWSTTQESAVSLIALAEYIVQSGEWEADYRYRALLDGKPLSEGNVGRDNFKNPINLVVALADLQSNPGSQLTLQRQADAGQTGKGRLYYTLRMRDYEDAGAVKALDQGLALSREYVAVDSVTLTPTGQLLEQAKVGDVIQVRLTLQVPQNVHYLAVEDMLPAGLEALDTSLKTVTTAAAGPTLEEAGGDQPYWSYWNQTEVRDNRVALFATDLPKGTYHYTFLARATTAGSFQTLPATAYQMYAPEVFGRSAGTTFTVTGP